MKTQMKETDISWKDYEYAVFQECERILHTQDAEVIKDTHIVGRYSGVRRQIDVLIRFLKEGKVDSTCLVECKHYAQKINVKIVDSFIGCLEDVNADKGIIVSEKGFTKAAINRAYKGKDDIEIDILSLGELQQFQALGGIVYGGENALIIAPPFGWIIDGKHRIDAPAVFYRRGLSFDEATRDEKEWMYLQFWAKEHKKDTLAHIVGLQNHQQKIQDEDVELRMYELDGLLVREAYLSSYPTPEITVYREFDRFYAFLVLFCPECYIQRDTKKAISILKKALPMIVGRKEDDVVSTT